MPFEKIVKYLIILLSIIFFSCSKKNATDTITLIPYGFTGPIKINLCDGKGVDEKFENGKRVYKIGNNGLLTTKFNAEYGWHFNEYYYVKNNGQRQKIRLINSNDKSVNFDKDSVYVFGESFLGIVRSKDSTGTHQTCPSIVFYIDKYRNIEKGQHELIMFSFENIKLLNEK